jgi:hypothetical protein
VPGAQTAGRDGKRLFVLWPPLLSQASGLRRCLRHVPDAHQTASKLRGKTRRQPTLTIGPYFTSDGRVDLTVARHAVDAVATELGVAAASVEQMDSPGD